MAYLKGGTVVDGNLYVEGSLRIKSVEDIEGNQFTYISDSEGRDKRIPVFTGTHAMMEDSFIEQSNENGSLTYTIKSIGGEEIALPFSIGNEASSFEVSYNNHLKGKKVKATSPETTYEDVVSSDAPELVQYWSY